MNQPSVYLDTTIPSYLFEEREELKALIQITQQWWHQERQNFELYLSEETLTELNKGNYPNKTEVLNRIAEVLMLPPHSRIAEIVTVYVDNYLMPREVKADAIHLAYASVYGLDFLVTWNYNHLANANKRQHITGHHFTVGMIYP